MTSWIADLIIKATNCKEEDVDVIENMMRDEIFHSTLDWQTEAQLIDAAKKAYRFLPLRRILHRVIDEIDEEMKNGKKFDTCEDYEKEIFRRYNEEKQKTLKQSK